MSPTSLTAELANPRSRVSRLLTQHLPGSALHDAYSNAVRGLTAPIRPAEALSTVPWTILGTAIDYRIRMWLGEKNHPGIAEGITIFREFQQTGTDTPEPYAHAAAAGDLLLNRMAAYAAATAPLTATEDDDAARLAIVGARYDAVFRTIAVFGAARAIGYFTDLRLSADPVRSLAVLTGKIPRSHVDDIRRQLAAATRALADIKGTPLTCSPTFAGSPHVGHAEGDIIAGGMLIDVKSTIMPRLRPAQARKWFHQLAGYLLLDYDNAHQIEAVAVYLSRQAALLSWPVGEFLHLMGARMPLRALRDNLKNTLAPHPHQVAV